MGRRAALLFLLVVCASLWHASAALAAKPVLIIRGAGFGHGVGMSQYGARGMALRGHSYERILRHYYSGTELGKLRGGREVRVLMQSGTGSVSFSGANLVGLRRASPAIAYRIVPDGQRLELYNSAGDRLGRFTSPLTVMGPGAIQLGGMALNGQVGHSYRGWLELNLNGRGGVDVINEVPLDQYVAGVIGSEVSVRWPAETLKAQAVAARTYAITTRAGGALFDQYPDTRSQVYGGVSSEHQRTAAAVRATRGEVVTHEDKPVTTYFFSTSGGRTEHVEYSFLDSTSRPWLRSVRDPYDTASPRHRWRITMAPAEAGKRLRGLVKGRFLGIRVIRRGASPRVVVAEIVGTRGITAVSGGQLRARLDLPDTWAYFAVVG